MPEGEDLHFRSQSILTTRLHFAQCLSRHPGRFVGTRSLVVPLDCKPCLPYQVGPSLLPRDFEISQCNLNVCLCACYLRRGIVCLFHRLASWHRQIEWISDGNGDTIENCQNPPSDGVLFSVHPDAFQIDRTFVHETRSTLASARSAPPMESRLVSCRSVRWSFPRGSRTKRSPLFPSDSIELRQDFPVQTRVQFLSIDRFHGNLAGLDPNGKVGPGQHPIWGSSAPTGRRSPFFGGWSGPPGVHPRGPKKRITEIGRLETKDESATTCWPHLTKSGRRCR